MEIQHHKATISVKDSSFARGDRNVPMPAELAELLHRERIKRGWTHEEVGQRLGITNQTVAKMEMPAEVAELNRSSSRVVLKNVQNYCTLLGIDLEIKNH